MNVRTRLAVGAALAGLLAGGYWLLSKTGALTTILDASALHARIVELGPWGPLGNHRAHGNGGSD